MAYPAGEGGTSLRQRQALAFEYAPTSMWLQDLSLLKQRLDVWRGEGLVDLRACLAGDAGRVEDLLGRVRLVAVNRETLRLYEAADEGELLAAIRTIFGDDQIASFVEVICQLWDGALRTSVVTRNYTVRGRSLDVNYKGRLLPGHEADWAAYLICVEDVTLQETALRDLEAARVHDPLTGLFNRAFLNDEMDRLETSAEPLALAVIDLNGLKAANDRFGHKAGDDLLRRMGDVLRAALPDSCRPVRLGGDEFVVILPGLPAVEVEGLVSRIRERAASDDAGPWALPLSFSVGTAWRGPGESMDHLLGRADRDMYEAKRAFHAKGAGGRAQPDRATD